MVASSTRKVPAARAGVAATIANASIAVVGFIEEGPRNHKNKKEPTVPACNLERRGRQHSAGVHRSHKAASARLQVLVAARMPYGQNISLRLLSLRSRNWSTLITAPVLQPRPGRSRRRRSMVTGS